MIYFVRHGQSQANVDNVFAGPRLSAPLTTIGKKQAEAAGQRILDEKLRIGRIITSPIERAHETAQFIARTIGYGSERYSHRPSLGRV